jgi:hypothetical protein
MQENAMSDDEREKARLEMIRMIADTRKLVLEADKLSVEAVKLKAEAGKMSLEIFWYPVAIAIGMFGAAAIVTALIIKFL